MMHFNMSCFNLDLAMNGVATQSSERSSNPASRVIDGVTKFPSCSHTSEHTVKSFLMVDIKKIAEIFQVTIFNRIDDVTVMRRLKNFSIFIGKTLDTFKICVTNEDMSSDIEKTFECHFIGRYVKIQLHIAEWFHLCEVIIIGRYL